MVPTRRLYCSVYGCLNSTISHANLTYFKLPADPERRVKWLHLISREDVIDKPSGSYTVCEAHFHPHDILPGKHRKKLKTTSLPALCLPNSQQTDVCTQTDEGTPVTVKEELQATIRNDNINGQTPIDSNETESKIQMLFCIKAEPEEINDSKMEIEENPLNNIEPDEAQESDTQPHFPSNVEPKIEYGNDLFQCRKRKFHQIDDEKDTLMDLCETYLTEDLAELVKAQVYLNLRHTEFPVSKVHKHYMMFCFNLYQTSPQAYSELERVLNFPSPKVLKDSIPITTKLEEQVLSILKTKVENMTELERNCSVVIHEIDLKANFFYDIKEDRIIGFNDIDGVQSAAAAKQALVVTMQGIFVDWKQPLAYALVSDYPNLNDISKWINNLLKKLLEIGFNVRTFTSKVDPEVYDVAKIRSVTIDRPYFDINKRKIYYIYDATLLIIEVRDSFSQHDFHFDDRIAKFEHIVKFYDGDKKKNLRLAPKLADNHIKVPKSDKNKVHLATQVLSRSVAAGISAYVDFAAIDKSGRDTAELIKLINDLFDALNCSSGKEYAHRTPFLDKMLLFFQNLKLVDTKNAEDVTSNVKFIKSFQITIISILLLFEDLKSEGIAYLPTERLSHDGVEDVLGQVKRKNGKTTRPTARLFVTAFRKLFLSSIIKTTRKQTLDMEKVINSLKNMKSESLKINNNVNAVSDADTYDAVEIPCSEYNKLTIPKKHSIVCISSFLLRKSFEKHKDCEILRSYVKPTRLIAPVLCRYSTNSPYSRYKNYSKDTKSDLLVVPRDDFVNYVETMEVQFRTSFERQHMNCKITSSIYKRIKHMALSPSPCPCFPTVYMKKLFIRMRMFFTMQFMLPQTK